MTKKQIMNNIDVLFIEAKRDTENAEKSLHNFVSADELKLYEMDDAIGYINMAIAEFEGVKALVERLKEAN